MKKVTLLAVGDITLQIKDNSHPFRNVSSIFEKKDILFGNLETVLSDEGEPAKKSVVLKSSPIKGKYLKDVDFDVLNIANNHILDLGIEGLKNTLNTLENYNLNYIGTNSNNSNSKSLILEKNGIKLGFLGYTIGRFKENNELCISKLNEKQIISDIKSLKAKCNFVVVSLHWGTENVFYPSPKQIDLAHCLIDTGATLILGHHPHVIQGIEKYKNGLIAYSLGNFQFDTKLSQSKISDSIIFSVDFDENGIQSYEVIPVVIDENFVPKVAKDDVKKNILNFVSDISQPFFNNKITNKWWFEEIGEEYLIGNLNSYVARIKKYGILPFIECCFWLVTPFCLKCYAGFIRRNICIYFNGEYK
ncbi:MAG: CapA family protein [Methanolobus sp.]|uniref:CapA family protein n=1 Tax=Methanolobus sp. TaxID=1874737 RepID=UPI0027316B1D|nr:CapA family protein [Methanolobus sp.]MDP2216441.1 CapA family protein [Methanolobus sp.]